MRNMLQYGEREKNSPQSIRGYTDIFHSALLKRYYCAWSTDCVIAYMVFDTGGTAAAARRPYRTAFITRVHRSTDGCRRLEPVDCRLVVASSSRRPPSQVIADRLRISLMDASGPYGQRFLHSAGPGAARHGAAQRRSGPV